MTATGRIDMTKIFIRVLDYNSSRHASRGITYRGPSILRSSYYYTTRGLRLPLTASNSGIPRTGVQHAVLISLCT